MSPQQSYEKSPSADVGAESQNDSRMVQSDIRAGSWMASCPESSHHESGWSPAQAMHALPGSTSAGRQPAPCQRGRPARVSSVGYLGYDSKSLQSNAQDINQPPEDLAKARERSTLEDINVVPQPSKGSTREDEQPEAGSGHGFAEILNKVMIDNSDRLIALLKKELDRQNGVAEEACELQHTRPTGIKPKDTESQATETSETRRGDDLQNLGATGNGAQAGDDLEGLDHGSGSTKSEKRNTECRL